MTLEEQKLVAIDYYVNLMRIKANEKGEINLWNRYYRIGNLVSKLK